MRTLVTAISLATASALSAQANLSAISDSVFSRWNSTHGPGCAVGVARGGKTLLMKGYGMADLENGAPISAETIFESGSVAKQFTATAVLMLAMDGKLDLSDPVRKHLPEFPQYDRVITIRHLLTHTSGLREWSNLVAVQGWPRGQRAHTQRDLLDIVFRQKSLNYPVGDFYSYTNSGYATAMSLVERVSGKSFEEFSQERIFRPLGMTKTRWRDDFTRVVRGRAQAYSLARNEWHLDMPFEDVVGPGGLLTTVGDWLIWNEALAKGGLRPGHTDSLTRRMTLTSGRQITYALGVTVSQYRGVTEVAHSGSTAGYQTYLTRFPDRGNLSIAVLCNSASATPTAYARQIADRIILDFPAPIALDTTRIEAGALNKFVGVYRSARHFSPLYLTEALATRARGLPGGWYLVSNARTQFITGADGNPTGLRVVGADNDTVRYTYAGAEPWKPTPPDLKAFEGSYRTDEAGATYQLRVVGDSLVASIRPGVSVSLTPLFPDGFVRGGRTVWFTRERGRVNAMHFSEARMWDLVLQRLP